ncbi:tripartite tricarboxylate transporter substrate binding protein BugD [Bradyrhizobium jicamae]|uniref:Bug family tripartite tricarboxylate transporter substrate binding protein n=1 Tax=Bradyrhizobium jicamae TaxID=280332 RepID=UPI001BAC35FC|nr:tripartite tricarboxylate transporter substrate-binding protein [Bradyrhizobium jicamae]MBR0754928.1 tripartite tricarboxylate transporter substrate binding protein BugD [Bradyrhizobium jicamae]
MGHFFRNSLALGCLALWSAISASSASAETYPSRPLTLIVPFAAGGAADTTGRIMADAMARHLGRPVIVENVGGAGGAIGSLRGKKAQPDGYTIGLGHMGTHAAAVGANARLGYDPRKDFDYLGLVSTTPNIVFVRADFPAKTLAEFAAYARVKGGDLKMGHSGIGAASHITCILLFQLIGAEPTYVSYRGFGQTINDILSGAIDGSCDLVASVSGQVQAGSVKAFAVAAPERSPILPDVPTATEAGMPDFAAETWTGLYAPKGVPPDILAKLRDAVAKSLDEPQVQARFLKIGATVPKPERRGGEAMQALVEREVVRWVEILGKAGLPEQ